MNLFAGKKIDLLIALLVVILFMLLSFRGIPLLEGLERIIYSVQMRLDLPRSMEPSKIAIVNIDDKSLKQLGPWPWPRNRIADMIQILQANGAKLIGLDLLFTQKEQNQGLEAVKRLSSSLRERSAEQPELGSIVRELETIQQAMDTDTVLNQTVKKSGSVILPVLGSFGAYGTELVMPADSPLQASSLRSGSLSKELRARTSVADLKMPYEELSANCRGLGHINLSPNGSRTGQSHLPFINYRGNIIPSMPLRLTLDYLNGFPGRVTIRDDSIQLNGQTIPTTDGEIFIKFKGSKQSFPYYSFVDILNVKKVPAVFEGKIVLIGYSASEGRTTVNTPVDPSMPHVELTANIAEGFMTGRYLKRPKSMPYIEAILMALFGLALATALPRLNYFPRTMVTGAALLVIFAASLVLFMAMNIWLKTIYMGLMVMSLYVVYSVKELVVSERSVALSSRENIETNRMLGLSLQSQGLLDLAFEKFRKCPVDDAMKDVLYNLGLDFERKRMINKAVSVYEYILQRGGSFRDLEGRIPKLRALSGELRLGKFGKEDGKITLFADLETKPTVGRYEILEQLGQGAMGIVYKARDPKINRLVAIKTIRFSDDFEEKQVIEVKERFFKEAELAGKLAHPSIISIYDVGEDYELTCMAMELLDGTNLEPHCEPNNLLPQRKALFVIQKAAEALDFAHTQGVVHRDVKPGNIMLLKNGTVKVTDFGIAKAVASSQTKSGIILGTPNYMSPEQINGRTLDGRSDIFSLGAVLYQLLTGHLPFTGKTLTELFYQVTQVKHPSLRTLNPKVLPPCEQILDRALAKDPEDRFQRAGDFSRYLRLLGEKVDRAIQRRQQTRQP